MLSQQLGRNKMIEITPHSIGFDWNITTRWSFHFDISWRTWGLGTWLHLEQWKELEFIIGPVWFAILQSPDWEKENDN